MDLKGSKTAKNLMTAFAGESQARNRYTYFSSKARAEGYVQIADIFEETAGHEREHAKRLFKFMTGGSQEIIATEAFPFGVIASTAENLKESADGEHGECTTMYPNFAIIAREEGFMEIADTFEHIAIAEKFHEKRFLALRQNILDKTVFKKPVKVTWRCRNCGYTHEGEEEAPKVCPACAHPQAHFEILCENY